MAVSCFSKSFTSASYYQIQIMSSSLTLNISIGLIPYNLCTSVMFLKFFYSPPVTTKSTAASTAAPVTTRSTAASTAAPAKVKLTLTMQETYTSDLADSSSPAFQNLAQKTKDQVGSVGFHLFYSILNIII